MSKIDNKKTELDHAPLSRRALICGLLSGTALAVTLNGCKGISAETPTAHKISWDDAVTIAAQIKDPVIPDQQFLITDFGAASNDDHDNTAALKKTILACSNAGGGSVVVPKGIFKTAAIHLRSNVNLHLEDGATLSFLTDPNKYLPAVFTRFEGTEYMGYSPLIYAYKCQNVSVTGNGTLEGNADPDTWWPWKGRWSHANVIHEAKSNDTQKAAGDLLRADAENHVPPHERIYTDGSYLRPPFIQFYGCKNVLIQDVTIQNAPFWLIHPVLSQNVTVRGVTCRSHGPNSDGCDPESCKNVLIEDCLFDTGDDCIAIKSGRNADGRRVNIPSENILVKNCQMKDGHGGVVIGSEISGGVRNVFVENCEMSSANLDRAIRIKTNAMRGGLIENIFVRNIRIGQVTDAFVINFLYEEGPNGDFLPTVRNIELSNIHCVSAKRVMKIQGFENALIQNIKLENIVFENVTSKSIIQHVKNVSFKNVTVSGKAVHSIDGLL